MPPQNKTKQQVYDDATKAAQTAAQTIGGTYSPTTGLSITPEVLKEPAPALSPYVESPIPDVASIFGATSEMTAPEKQAQGLSDQLMQSMNVLTGKSAYTAEQETLAGLPELQKQQQDLQSQLTAQINEQKAIPLQIQQEFAGRGATAGGVAPIQTARLRENAIKALTTSSLLNAVQGNIANARTTVDRLVSIKYGPEEEKIKALQSNLDLIQKSPAYTEAQKSRAIKQQLLMDERARLLEQNKDDEKTIYALAGAAVKNNPGNQAVQIAAQKAIESGNLRTAFSLVGQYQSNPEETALSLLDQEYKRQQIQNLIADRALTNTQREKAIAEAVPVQSPKEALQQNEALSLVQELLKPDAIGKKAAIGASIQKLIPFAQGAGLQPDRTAFEQRVETLKSNLTLDNLKLLKGAMSDKDLLFLNSIGSSLNTNMSETEFDKELRRIEAKLINAGATSMSGGSSLLSKYGL